MAMSLRFLLLLAGVIVAASGCFTPMPVLPPRAPRPGFAELQQDGKNKQKAQEDARKGVSGVRQADWTELENDGIDRALTSPYAGSPISLSARDGRAPPMPLPPWSKAANPERLSQLHPATANAGAARSMPPAPGNPELRPNDASAERPTLLAQMLEKTQEEARGLRERAALLEQQLAAQQRTRPEEIRKLDQATEELKRARLQLEALHAETAALRERERRLDRQDLETLREVIALLEQLARDVGPREHAH